MRKWGKYDLYAFEQCMIEGARIVSAHEELQHCWIFQAQRCRVCVSIGSAPKGHDSNSRTVVKNGSLMKEVKGGWHTLSRVTDSPQLVIWTFGSIIALKDLKKNAQAVDMNKAWQRTTSQTSTSFRNKERKPLFQLPIVNIWALGIC